MGIALEFSFKKFEAGDLVSLSIIIPAVLYMMNPKSDPDSIFTSVYVENYLRFRYEIQSIAEIDYLVVPDKSVPNSVKEPKPN